MKHFLTITLSLLLAIPVLGQNIGGAYAQAVLTSNHLIPGESTYLWVQMYGASPDGRPEAPEADGIAINFVQSVARIDENRNLTQAFVYRVSGPKTGKYTIPAITLTSRGRKLPTSPVEFEIHNVDSLTNISTGNNSPAVKIGWFPAKTTLYQGEINPLLLKVYAPERLRVASFGLPDPKKDNCLAWRFSLPEEKNLSTTSINGEVFRVASYRTNMSGIQPGTATFGPTSLRLIVRKREIVPRIGSRLTDVPIKLSLPEIKFSILPLPEGAPPGFNGAVGHLQINATCAKTTLKETDPTEVMLSVSGTGNLPTVESPALTGSGWKVIDTSKVTRGEERRFTSGRVVFRQLLRPENSGLTAIPPYAFSFFDPREKTYHTLTTSPISVNIIPDTNNRTDASGTDSDPEALGTPPGRMKDILGFIHKPDIGTSEPNKPIAIWWHLVPSTIAIFLIWHALYSRRQRKLALRPDITEKKKALHQLDEATDTRTFYRRAGRIIDQWHTPNDDLREVLAERDALCFLPENAPCEEITPERRKKITELLRRSTKLTLITLITLVLATHSRAEEQADNKNKTCSSARQAWIAGDYQQALHIYQSNHPDPNKTPADILYNIGNCHHRLSQHGHAALAWRRTLHVDSSHAHARQNLLYTELSQNASSLPQLPWQYHIAVLHFQTYITTLWICLWIIILASIIMIIHFKNKKTLYTSICVVLVTGIASLALAAAAIFHPDAHHVAPIEQQAVIVEKATLYPEAQRTSGTGNIQLPAASHIIVTAERGPWTHITTFDGSDGWVETKHLETIISSKTQ